MRHKWTKSDDIVALYLYLYGNENLNKNTDQISERLGMSSSSMKMRVANFKSIAQGKGLDHAALQSREVYKTYKDVDKIELNKQVKAIIE